MLNELRKPRPDFVEITEADPAQVVAASEVVRNLTAAFGNMVAAGRADTPPAHDIKRAITRVAESIATYYAPLGVLRPSDDSHA